MIVVASLYKLAQIGSKFSKEHRELERENAKVIRSYAESINARYEETGHWYEIDEAKTKKWHEDRQDEKEKEAALIDAKKTFNKEVISDFANEMAEIAVKKTRKQKN